MGTFSYNKNGIRKYKQKGGRETVCSIFMLLLLVGSITVGGILLKDLFWPESALEKQWKASSKTVGSLHVNIAAQQKKSESVVVNPSHILTKPEIVHPLAGDVLVIADMNSPDMSEWGVQIGAFRLEGQSIKMASAAREKGFDALVLKVSGETKDVFRVRVNVPGDKEKAEQIAEALEKAGFDTLVCRNSPRKI